MTSCTHAHPDFYFFYRLNDFSKLFSYLDSSSENPVSNVNNVPVVIFIYFDPIVDGVLQSFKTWLLMQYARNTQNRLCIGYPGLAMKGIPTTQDWLSTGYPGLAKHGIPRVGYAGDTQGWLSRGYPCHAIQGIPRAGYAANTQGMLRRGYPGLAMHWIPRSCYSGDIQDWLCIGYHAGLAMKGIPRTD